MPDIEERLQRTAKAATRLLKSRIRQHLFEAKRGLDADPSKWEALLLLEKSFAGPATREWQDALSLWSMEDLQDQRVLRMVLADQFAEAASEVLSVFEPESLHEFRRIIEEYHRSLPVNSLLGEAL